MILVVLLIAFLLRLVNLNQSLWLDEAVQAITAKESLAYIFQEIIGDFHPPLFHFLMHFWLRVFGNSEIALRMPSVIFGIGTVYFVYKLGGLGGLGKLGKLVGALFLATAPFHIYYSQEIRMYSMVTFFTAGSFYFLYKLLTKEDKTTLFWYLVFTLLALYSDYYAFLALLAQWLIILKEQKFKLIFYSLILFLLYLPWGPTLWQQVKAGMSATQALPQWAKLVNLSSVKALPLTFVKFSLGRITIFNKFYYALVALALFSVYGWVLSRGFLRREKTNSSFLTLTGFWLIIPITLAWLASFFIPNYQPFRLLLVLPAFYLLLTQGVLAFSRKKIKFVLIGFVLIVNLLSLSIYYFVSYFHREDWQGATRFLKSQTDCRVILPSETSSWPVKYYDQEGKVKLVSVGLGVKEIEKVEGIGGKKIFYLRYLVPLFDPKELILAELKQKGYTKVEEINFNQIPIWKFTK